MDSLAWKGTSCTRDEELYGRRVMETPLGSIELVRV
jgi:hypothetical protein